ncbi:hypothetical protein ACJX0J_015886, partial [Zea mays]
MKQFKMDMLFFSAEEYTNVLTSHGFLYCCLTALHDVVAIYFTKPTGNFGLKKVHDINIAILFETLTALFPLGQISYEFFADMYCFRLNGKKRFRFLFKNRVCLNTIEFSHYNFIMVPTLHIESLLVLILLGTI